MIRLNTVALLGLIVSAGCDKQIHCNSVREDGDFSTIIFFRDHLDSYTFKSATEEIKINQIFIENEPYIHECSTFPMNTCFCENDYVADYGAIRNTVTVRRDKHDDYFINRYTFSFSNNSFHGSGIGGREAHIDLYISRMLIEEVQIAGTTFNEVIIYESFDDTSNSSLEVVVKPGKGLVAFAINDELYERVE